MRRTLLFILVVTLGLVGLAILVVPTLVEDEISSRLRAQLTGRGIEAEWSAFESDLGGRFTMVEVRLEAPEHGARVEAERLDVTIALDSLLRGEPEVVRVELSGAQVEVDVAPWLERARGDEGGGEEAGSAAGAGRLRQLVERALEKPPEVVLDDAQVTLRRGERELAQSQVSLSGVEAHEGLVRASLSGSTRLVAEGLPGFARREVGWRLALEVAPKEGQVRFEVDPAADAEALLELREASLAELRVGRLTGGVELRTRAGRVLLDEVRARIGGVEQPAVDAAASEVELAWAKGRPRMRASEPVVVITPARLGSLAAVATWARALAGEEGEGEAAAAPSPAPGKQESRRVLAGRLLGRFQDADVDVRGLQLGVRLEDERGDFDELTLLEHLDARIAAGAIELTGRTAGGTFTGTAQFLPGQLVPAHAALQARGIRLEEIPGMPQARTELPSRGTSGRLGGTVDLTASLRRARPAEVVLRADAPIYADLSIDWKDGLIDLAGVSDEALDGIDARGEAELVWHPLLAKVEMARGELTYGPAVVQAEGSVVDFPLDTKVRLEAKLEEIECQRAFRALPDGLLGPYRRLELKGKMAPSLSFYLPLYDPRRLRLRIEDWQVDEELTCELLDLNAVRDARPEVRFVEPAPTGPHLSVAQPGGEAASEEEREEGPNPKGLDDVMWLNRPFVKAVTEGVSEEAEVEVGPGLASYVPIHELPAWVPGAAYLSEEMDFYEDPAINLGLIEKALRLNLERGRFVYGGSTVTQQLVKNLFLTRDKTLSRKLQEALVAWRMTREVSKDRVLELYLNCIEYGPDVYGIGPAAEYYFGKDARELTAEEAIFLAMLKPAPWQGPKIVRREHTPTYPWWADRVEVLFGRLVDYGLLTQAQAEAEKPWGLEWDEEGRYLPQEPGVPGVDDGGDDGGDDGEDSALE